MKKIILSLSIIALFYSCKNTNKGNQKITLKNIDDSFSYIYGINVGTNLKMSNVKEINFDVFMAALEKSLKYGDSNSLISQEMAQEIYYNYISSKMFSKEKNDEETFFVNLKKDKSLQNTPKGLVYKVLRPGNGKIPLLTDSFAVNMNVKNKDFQDIFPPLKNFVLNHNFRLFEDFDDIFTVADEGSKIQYFIHSKQAFGSRGHQQFKIPPYTTLVIELEVLRIKE